MNKSEASLKCEKCGSELEKSTTRKGEWYCANTKCELWLIRIEDEKLTEKEK